jgi:threonine synthase
MAKKALFQDHHNDILRQYKIAIIMSVYYINPRTENKWFIENPLWSAPDDGGYLNLSEGNGIKPSEIDKNENSLWRYKKALRLNSDIVTLGEGFTPLITTKWQNRVVNMKLDYLMPSGSFKDRGTAVMMNYLRQQNIDYILEDSSGNAGSSIATYAAFMGMRCRVVVPAAAPQGKKTQIYALGAEVIEIEGSREEVTNAALSMSKDIFYAGHNYQAYFLEGTKTLAFELWEQLHYRAPDAVIVPLGQGSNVIGLYLGFKELLRGKQINKLPRIYGIQAANCAPYHACYAVGKNDFVPIIPKPTIADGIASFRPVRLKENMEAIVSSGGECLVVEEEEIISSCHALHQRGFYTEITSAVVIAAFEQMIKVNKIAEQETTILVLTGNGLKATDRIASLMQK